MQLHLVKTEIVYCIDSNCKEDYKNCIFTFLGYEFKSQKARGASGKEFTIILSAISANAKKVMKQKIKNWHLLQMTNQELKDIQNKYHSVIQEWLNYCVKYDKRELAKVLEHINYYGFLFKKNFFLDS